jgi:ribosomal protein L7Ae-like RNA K-turn-binding protein
MGGSLSVCPNRKVSAAAAAAPKRATPDPTPAKDSNKLSQGAPKTKNFPPEPAAVPLPTKSWQALLKEPSLNPDAKPFYPGQKQANPAPAPSKAVPDKRQGMPAPPPGLSKPSYGQNTSGQSASDEPEWMQYLAKRFNGPAPTPVQEVSRPGPLSVAGQSKGPSPEQQQGSNCGGLAIHTDTYLKLLREGTPLKKKPAHVNSTKRAPNRGQSTSVQGSAELREAVCGPMTSSCLGKQWSIAMDEKQGNDTTTEEPKKAKITQDDIFVEKVLVDTDLSDPAYWSETECIEKRVASAHSFGRRPKMPLSMIRTYVMQNLNHSLDECVGMMLLRLQRYTDQQRSLTAAPANDDGNDGPRSQQRRFVIGLKEVGRRTKQSKVECLIVAPDIEEDAQTGGLDDRMRELLAAAYQKKTPVIFALSRARLGKALGKSLHISVLGILDSTGAKDLLAESVRLASEGRQEWLARLGK